MTSLGVIVILILTLVAASVGYELGAWLEGSTGYRWWTVAWGNSAVYGHYLKLGPVTFCQWEAYSDWFLEIVLFGRWSFTLLQERITRTQQNREELNDH